MEKMVKEKELFIIGARERGRSEKKAIEIFELLIPFAGYGFNKSHAAGYSVLAYRTAFLKANYPSEFMAASLSNEIHSQDKDKLSECIDESRKLGLAIDPPDINRSGKLFSIDNGRFVYGFLGIKGIGDGPADEIVGRRREGLYSSFMDFLKRVDLKMVSKNVLEKLIKTGAFDKLNLNRETLMGNLERSISFVQKLQDEKQFGQSNLFDDTGENEEPNFEFENFPEAGREDRLKTEKELLGFYFSGHPMDGYQNIRKYASELNLRILELGTVIEAGTYTVIGMLKSLRTHVDKKGKVMAFGVLQDYGEEIDLVFFAKIWETCKDLVEPGKILALKGSVDPSKDKNPGKPSLVVSALEDLDKLAEKAETLAAEIPSKEVHIRLAERAAENEADLFTLKDCLEGQAANPARGRIQVFIHVPLSSGLNETVIRTESRIDRDISASIKTLAQCAIVADVWAN